MKRKGFKSFVLKVCETKGFADAFLRKCVNLKELARKSWKCAVENRKQEVIGEGVWEGMGGLQGGGGD